MDDYQTQIDALAAKVAQISASPDISRDTETALRERLGPTSTTQAFPVGSVFISTVATDPSSLLGYGTWAAFGTGQVMVSYSAGDPDFGTLLATGGEKTHVLTIPEMPSHDHTIGSIAVSGGGSNNFSPTNSAINTSNHTSSTGGGGAHNNLQPFVVVQFWKRTA